MFDYFCAACGQLFGDFENMIDPCSRCGCTEKRTSASGGFKVSPELSARGLEWFYSDATQAKLKSGEYQIAPKSHNINHF